MNYALIVCLLVSSISSRAAELKQKTTAAFDKYVAATEARIHSELRPDGIFLYVDALKADAMKSLYDKLMKGEVLVEQRKTYSPGLSSDVPDGMVHHWIGIIFIPGVTFAQVLPIVQDYDRRAELYKPDVSASHLISHQGDDYRFFLRLYQKRFTTVIFNTEYVTHWVRWTLIRRIHIPSVPGLLKSRTPTIRMERSGLSGRAVGISGGSTRIGDLKRRTTASTFNAKHCPSLATFRSGWVGY
jgi:hypothetical protein